MAFSGGSRCGYSVLVPPDLVQKISYKTASISDKWYASAAIEICFFCPWVYTNMRVLFCRGQYLDIRTVHLPENVHSRFMKMKYHHYDSILLDCFTPLKCRKERLPVVLSSYAFQLFFNIFREGIPRSRRRNTSLSSTGNSPADVEPFFITYNTSVFSLSGVPS